MTQDTTVALGVDGGAGSLKFAVRKGAADPTFYECHGANPALVGMQEFLSRLSQGILDALGRAGVAPEDVASAGFGLSGVDRPLEIATLTDAVKTRMLKRCSRVWVGNDALAALRQGAGSLGGLVLIAGTGSICFAVASNGASGRVGGWGGELGDEGSGFWMGQQALLAVCHMADGRMPRSDLEEGVLRKLGLERAEELIPWCTSLTREEFKRRTATLYPVVAELAADGDQAARRIILNGVTCLVEHAITGRKVLLRLEREALQGAKTEVHASTDDDNDTEETEIEASSRTKLVCAGGLFSGDPKFFETFIHQLRRQKDAFECVLLTQPASLGALALGEEASPF